MKLKRIMAAVLSVTFVILPVNAVNASDSMYDKEIEVIKALSVIDGVSSENFSQNESVSRAEFLVYAMQMVRKEPISEETSYTDIRPDYWAAGYVATAEALGIISGYGGGQFRPDREITYHEAVKILLSALGYGGTCDRNGGFPDGYINQASRLNITKGIALSGNDAIDKATAVKLIYNAIDVPVMLAKSLSGDGEYTAEKDKDFLSEYHNIFSDDGIMESNDETGLTGEGTKEGCVIIDGTSYYTGVGGAEKLLGMRVKFFYNYNESEDERTLLYIEEYKNKTVEFESHLIKDFDGEQYVVYKYDRKNSATYKAKISKSTDVVYNGRAVTKYDKAFIKPSYGKIRLIDNDGDDVYDVAFVDSYRVVVVQGYQAAVGKIYDKYDSKSPVNLKLYDEYLICDANGKEVSDASIREYSILLLLESFDKKYARLIVSNKAVSGAIEAVSDDDGIWVELGGESYRAGERLPAAALEDRSESTFYLDANGFIQAFRQGVSEGTKYGYIAKGRMIENENGEKVAWLKIFNSDGKFITATTSYEKLKLNGIYEAEETAVEAALCDSEKKVIPQLVGYKLNLDGEISMLDTVGTPTGSDDVLDKVIATKGRYKRKNSSISGKVGLASNTKVLAVPSDPEDMDEKSFTSGTLDMIPNDTDIDNFVGYKTVKDSPLADILLIYDYGVGGMIYNDTFAVITKIKNTLNEDDEIVPVLSLMKRGEIKDYKCRDVDVVKNIRTFKGGKLGEYELGKGDTIMIALDGDGEIYEIELHYDYDAKTMMTTNNPANYTGAPGIMLMNVYDKYDDMIVTTHLEPKQGMTPEKDSLVYFKAGGYDIVVYDEELDECAKAGSVADINDFIHNGGNYSKAYISTWYGEPLSMVIYR